MNQPSKEQSATCASTPARGVEKTSVFSRGIAAAFVAQVILLAVAGWNNRWLFNADGVAYMRIASYYAHGQTDLMVSGYWGPLLSWLMAPLIMVGCPSMDAAHIVLAGSAVFFLLSCVAVFRSFQLPPWAVVLGTWIAMVPTIGWSVNQITPDLMTAGLIAFAVSQMMNSHWLSTRAVPIRSGLLWGAAYLAKAIAFPLSFFVGAGLGGLWILTRTGNLKQVSRSLCWMFLASLLVCAPWIGILSIKYHHLTFSTTGRIAHAILGPPDVERYHPYAVSFHQPQKGRITAWEDPSEMAYKYWSPLQSWGYARHQLEMIAENSWNILRIFKLLDLAGLGLVALGATLMVRRPWRERLGQERWRWILVPVCCLGALYAPVSGGEERFFYAVFPLILTAALGAVVTFVGRPGLYRLRYLCLVLIVVCFSGPGLVQVRSGLFGYPDPATNIAIQLAVRLKNAGVDGPIAGSGIISGYRTGLYAAYLTDQPWYGDEWYPTVNSFKKSKAKIIVVLRNRPIAAELAADPAFRDLDSVLFEPSEPVQEFPLKIFQLRES